MASTTTTPSATIDDDRCGIEQVVGGERRDGFASGEPMPGEKDLGGFAGRHAERRQIADGVAGDEMRVNA